MYLFWLKFVLLRDLNVRTVTACVALLLSDK